MSDTYNFAQRLSDLCGAWDSERRPIALEILAAADNLEAELAVQIQHKNNYRERLEAAVAERDKYRDALRLYWISVGDVEWWDDEQKAKVRDALRDDTAAVTPPEPATPDPEMAPDAVARRLGVEHDGCAQPFSTAAVPSGDAEGEG